MAQKIKVAVVGVGTIGAQVLYALARSKDVEVHGFDSYTPGHSLGAAGGENRSFGRLAGTNRHYGALTRRAYELWSQLENSAGRALTDFNGALTIAKAGSSHAFDVIHEIEERNLDIEKLEGDDLRRRFPFCEYEDDDIGFFDPMGGTIRPELTNLTAIDLAVAAGATLHSTSPVTSVRLGSTTAWVDFESEHLKFDQVIITTGAWAYALKPIIGDEVAVHRPVTAWFAPRDADLLRDAPVSNRREPHQYYTIPTFDKQFLKVGYSGLRQREIPTYPTAADYLVEPNDKGEFPQITARHFSKFHQSPVRINAYFEGYTQSANPIMQRVSDRLTIGAGFSGLGFKYAPVYGQILANLAMNRPEADVSFLERPDFTSAITELRWT